MPSPHTWLGWAQSIAPTHRADWLKAMMAEMAEIDDVNQKRDFAHGCFKSVLMDRLRSRKLLHYIARGAGACLIFTVSAACLWVYMPQSILPETQAAWGLIRWLCLFYVGAAGLLILSLRGLKIYAGLGLSIALTTWLYCIFKRPEFETLPLEFLTAITVEVIGFMAILIFAATYLNWLYDPELSHD